ncbi:uncharacterized protein [Phaseolus vulgaris]|uniref:uncharacterized protein n=1 Tax=Phaseolus vulgaris TaxID=3885 RepID=UPI0035CC0F6F
MIILNLNIRGVGGGTKARYLRHVIAGEGVDFVCLQETKAKVFTEAKCFSLWGDNKVGWIHHEGENGCGSLLSMWYEEAFSYVSHVKGKGFIAVFGKHIKSNTSCAVVNVYAACNLNEKKICWKELTEDYRILFWVGVCVAILMLFIDANSLFDLPLVGKTFTWFKSNGSAKSRLDRVLVSEEWMDIWPMCKQYVQQREVSDHCAIVVKSVDKDWGPKPFRSIDVWLKEKDFGELVKGMWLSYSVQGSAFTKVKEKLKCLKGDLKMWNKDVFGNIQTSKKRILQELEDLDCQDCCDDLGDGDRLKRMELVGRLKEMEKKLDSLICQKARANWFRSGDSSTKFFHTSLRWRRLRNEVKGVEVGGIWCENPPLYARKPKASLKADLKLRRIMEFV